MVRLGRADYLDVQGIGTSMISHAELFPLGRALDLEARGFDLDDIYRQGGIAGVGLAWLIVQSAVAIALLVAEVRGHWRSPLGVGSASVPSRAVVEPDTDLATECSRLRSTAPAG